MAWHVAQITMYCITLSKTSLAMIYPFEVSIDCYFCGRIDRTIFFDSLGQARCSKCRFFNGLIQTVKHSQSLVMPGSVELSAAMNGGKLSYRDYSDTEEIAIKQDTAIKHTLDISIVYFYRRFLDLKKSRLSSASGLQQWARIHFHLICSQCGTCSRPLSVQSNQERLPFRCAGCHRVLMLHSSESFFVFYDHNVFLDGSLESHDINLYSSDYAKT